MGQDRAGAEPEVTLLSLYYLCDDLYGVELVDGQLYVIDKQTMIDMLRRRKRGGGDKHLGENPLG